MNDARNRQPKGVPVGGQFATNEHDSATAGLSAGAWQEVSPSSGFPRFERTVTNPDGTAQYRVWVEDTGVNAGDVYVELTDLSDGRTASFRSFADGVDGIGDSTPIRINQAPPLLPDSAFSAPASSIASFDDFAADSDFVNDLTKKALARSMRVRSASPMKVTNLRAGDMIDFTPIYDDEYLDQGEISESDRIEAKCEYHVVSSIEVDDGMVTVETDKTTYVFPADYKVPIEGIDPDYIDDEED